MLRLHRLCRDRDQIPPLSPLASRGSQCKKWALHSCETRLPVPPIFGSKPVVTIRQTNVLLFLIQMSKVVFLGRFDRGVTYVSVAPVDAPSFPRVFACELVPDIVKPFFEPCFFTIFPKQVGCVLKVAVIMVAPEHKGRPVRLWDFQKRVFSHFFSQIRLYEPTNHTSSNAQRKLGGMQLRN